jgi:acetyl esterase
VQVAEYDPLRDDGIRYARAMQAAGTTVRLTEYVGMPHGYFSFPKVIRGSVVQALAELCAEQRYALHADPVPAAFPRVPTGLPEKTADTDAGQPGSAVDPIASRPVEDHPVGQYPVPQHSAD